MCVKKRRSDLDHSVFVLRNREYDQEVNQSKCKAETGPADKQVEDAQLPAVLQKAVCAAPAQKNSHSSWKNAAVVNAAAPPYLGIRVPVTYTGRTAKIMVL